MKRLVTFFWPRVRIAKGKNDISERLTIKCVPCIRQTAFFIRNLHKSKRFAAISRYGYSRTIEHGIHRTLHEPNQVAVSPRSIEHSIHRRRQWLLAGARFRIDGPVEFNGKVNHLGYMLIFAPSNFETNLFSFHLQVLDAHKLLRRWRLGVSTVLRLPCCIWWNMWYCRIVGRRLNC